MNVRKRRAILVVLLGSVALVLVLALSSERVRVRWHLSRLRKDLDYLKALLQSDQLSDSSRLALREFLYGDQAESQLNALYPGGVAAIVGDSIIFQEDVALRFTLSRVSSSDARQRTRLRSKIVSDLVDEALILSTAESQTRSLVISDGEVDRFVDTVFQDIRRKANLSGELYRYNDMLILKTDRCREHARKLLEARSYRGRVLGEYDPPTRTEAYEAFMKELRNQTKVTVY